MKLAWRLKASFHMIADDRGSQNADRRRSQRELFPYNRGQLRTIAEPTSVPTFQSAEVSKITGASCWRQNRIKTTWRESRTKFCCKQIYFFSRKIFLKRQELGSSTLWSEDVVFPTESTFSIASYNDHTQFLCCGIDLRFRRG